MKTKLIKTVDGYELFTQGFLKGSTNYQLIDALNIEEGNIRYKLSIKNCQAIERGYDLDELATEQWGNVHRTGVLGFIDGFQKALEILGDKKFSAEDVMLAWDAGVMSKSIIDNNWLGPIKQEKLKEHRDTYKEKLKPTSLQQTEWDVIVEMEDVFMKNSDQYVDEVGVGNYSTHSKKPKIDSKGCLILVKL